jgi:hypothetical protein
VFTLVNFQLASDRLSFASAVSDILNAVNSAGLYYAWPEKSKEMQYLVGKSLEKEVTCKTKPKSDYIKIGFRQLFLLKPSCKEGCEDVKWIEVGFCVNDDEPSDFMKKCSLVNG